MEEETEINNKKEKSVELEIVEFLASKGIYNLEQVKELLEPNFYAVIPTNILEKKTISANAKLLYAEIIALSKKNGKCFATNEYLAERLGVSKRTIPSLLKELKNDFLIEICIKRSKNGTYRSITPSLNNEGGHREITMGGIAKERYQKRNRQIEIEKKNNINNILAVANATATDISKIINFFKEVSPLTYKDWFGNKTERKASAELFNRLPMDKLEVLITKILPRLNVMPYVSKNCKAFKPSELLRNLDKIIVKVKELQQKRSQEKINIEI